MKKMFFAMAVLAFFVPTTQAAKVGSAAPDFTLTDSLGKPQKLSDYKGKFVVLEWTNHDCPFVHKHYDSGNMQKLQKTYTGKGVVWFSIVTSAPGREGYETPQEANDLVKQYKAAPTAVLLDTKGGVGKLYGAKSTPHMFIVDPKGTLIYNGAIDDKASTKEADIPGSKNYVAAALDEAMAGKPVTTAATKPYGCSVKYAKN